MESTHTSLGPDSDISAPPKVRFDSSAVDEDEETRLRRGTVSADLKNQIALRSLLGRKAVSLGYATNRNFSRSQSEASIFRPLIRPPILTTNEEINNPSTTLWESGYTKLSRVKSTSSVIGGLNDDILRAGWRRNEPGPYWEQCNELESDRKQLMENIEETQDGFDLEDYDGEGEFENEEDDLMRSINDDEDQEDKSNEIVTPEIFFNHAKKNGINNQRQFSKTKSMPVGGTFGTRPDQPTFHRPFDDTFMRMDVPF
ncbi:hypothetical protein CROQUDRAFT_360029 [Cronartium quercuum f. sp. fusiforme G11]|uniref:Uncharacterized protein n=1 Tax=Cronartium quercuum f. sp. fusiforme G11 TaxID=708437 RepID=A0A9P6NNW3_9BASI|nr:hypothetical protein CROQUDRAFT_360029 [Cronartium quercuum f. sp. fusiforme G11]